MTLEELKRMIKYGMPRREVVRHACTMWAALDDVKGAPARELWLILSVKP